MRKQVEEGKLYDKAILEIREIDKELLEEMTNIGYMESPHAYDVADQIDVILDQLKRAIIDYETVQRYLRLSLIHI